MTRRSAAKWSPLAVSGLFSLVVGAALRQEVPDVIDRPLLTGARTVQIPVPIPFASTDGLTTNRDLVFRVADAVELERADELRLVFGTFETTPHLRYGWLQVTGSGCVFQAPTARLHQNAGVLFKRTGTCGVIARGPADVTLRLALEGPARYARAALWTREIPPGATPLLTVTAFGRTLGVNARTVSFRGGPNVARIRLLAFMWEVRVGYLAVILGLALSLITGGSVWMTRQTGMANAVAIFGVAAGLALAYAVIVPPLQAPDEPDHLLSFAELTNRPAFAQAESEWAKRIHFYRMTFMADEHFTPADREVPFALDWPPATVSAEDVSNRSSTASRLWRGVAPFSPANPAHALLLFRIINAAILGGVLAAGTALLVHSAKTVVPGVLAVFMLSIPTLPFFSMQMSEVPFTLAAFILAGYGAVLLLDGATGRITGPLLGIAIALLATGPRSGWPLLITIASLGAGRILSNAVDRTRPVGDSIWFWGWLATPTIVLLGTRFLWIPSPAYDRWYLSSFDPRAGLSSMSFTLGLVGAVACGALIEKTMSLFSPVATALAEAARALCAAAAVGIATTLTWSVWAPLPLLANIEGVEPGTASHYVWAAMLPLVTAARVRGFDFFTWTLVWGGFGWADAILPSSAIAVATIVASGASIVTLAVVARDARGARALVMACGLAGLAGSAATTALTSYGLHRNVHGRYLVGVCIIGLCLLAGPAVLAKGRRISAAAHTTAVLAFAAGLHAFALCFLLEKYFG